MSRPIKALIGCGTILVFSLGVLILFQYWMQGFNNPFNDLPFDQKTWASNANSRDNDNPRGLMADDLLRKHLRKGMTRNQVQALLGEPDFSSSSNPWEYMLGCWSGFRMDADTLDVYFDDSNNVSRVRITQH